MQQKFIWLHFLTSPFLVGSALGPPRLMLTLGLLDFRLGVDRGNLLWPGDTIIRPVFMAATEMGL